MKKNKVKILLFLLCVLAFFLRFPGVFWGVQLNSDPKFISYTRNESLLIDNAREFTENIIIREAFYPKGFSFQIALSSVLIKPFVGVDPPQLTILGRCLSVFYGVLTVLLLFLLVKNLTGNEDIALLSSLFLSLNELHVAKSHFASTDVGTTFWIYLLMYCLLIYVQSRRVPYLIFAFFAIGIALALKLSLIVLIPLIYIFVQEKWGWKKTVIALFALFAIFFFANGGKYTLVNFLLTLNNVSDDNLYVRHFNKFLNIYSYLLILVTSFGLPIFILSCLGIKRAIQENSKLNSKMSRDIFFILLLPLIVHFISICFIAYPGGRHILPVIPFMAVTAAYGFMSIAKHKVFSRRRGVVFLISGFIVYQLIFVCSSEYNFWFDTRPQAHQWIKENIPKDETIAVFVYTYMPSLERDYRVVDLFHAKYVVIHEAYYKRYIRNILNPKTDYPPWEEVFHPDPIGFKFCQELFKGKLPYKLVKRFDTTNLTPEMILFKNFYGTPVEDGPGDILIYKWVGTQQQENI